MYVVRSHPLLPFNLGRFVLNDAVIVFRLSAQVESLKLTEHGYSTQHPERYPSHPVDHSFS